MYSTAKLLLIFFIALLNLQVLAGELVKEKVFLYKNKVYDTLGEAKSAVIAEVMLDTGISTKLKLNEDKSSSTKLYYQPYIDAIQDNPFLQYYPTVDNNPPATSLAAAIEFWKVNESGYGSARCQDSILTDMAEEPLIFYAWSSDGKKVSRAEYRATRIWYEYRNNNCEEVRGVVNGAYKMFQEHQRYKCSIAALGMVLPTTEYDIPRCNVPNEKLISVYDVMGVECEHNEKTPLSTLEKPSGIRKQVGNPIQCSSGQKIESDIIYQGSGTDPLIYKVNYNSPTVGMTGGVFIHQSLGNQRSDNHFRKLTKDNSGWVRKHQLDFGKGLMIQFYGHENDKYFISKRNKNGYLFKNNGKYIHTLPDGRRYIYNSAGELEKKVYGDGKVRTYTYTATGNISSISNLYGDVLQFFYNEAGLLERMVDPDNKEYMFEFDTNKNLIKVIFPGTTDSTNSDRSSIIYLYENSLLPKHLTGKINENGTRIATWNYDDSGKAISSEHGTNLEKVELDFSEYNKTKVTTLVSDELSNETVYYYETVDFDGEARKLLTRFEQKPCFECNVGSWEYEYDENGHVNKSISPEGKVTLFAHTSEGLEVSRTEAFGTLDERTTTIDWNSLGRVSSLSFANLRTEFFYDTKGLIETKKLIDLNTGEVRATSYTYGRAGVIHTINGALSGDEDTLVMNYDYDGNLTHATKKLEASYLGNVSSNINFNDVDITSYGGSQDNGTGNASVEDNGISLRLTGNTWKKISLPYTITPNTILEFDFSSPIQAEIQAIGFDTDDVLSKTQAFQVFGTQEWGNQEFSYYSGSVTHYRIPVGDYFTGSMNYIIFANDHDISDPLGQSLYSNLRVFEENISPFAEGITYSFSNYDANGRVGSITDPNSTVTTLTYTPRGWLETSTSNGALTQYKYYPTGSIKEIISPNGQNINYEYDDGERLIAIEDSLGNRVEYIRDLMGNVTESNIKDPNGIVKQKQTAVFNALGQLKKSLGNNGQVEEVQFDKEGNFVNNQNALNHSTTSSYDALNRLQKSIDPDNAETTYEYNSQDLLTKVTDAENKSTQYEYNAFGEITKLTSPDTGVTTFTYDSAGNMLTKTDARGVTVTLTYDALNRVKTQSYSNSIENIVYSYDDTTNGNKGIGRLTSVTDQSGSTSYVYNAFGQVTQETRVIEGNTYITQYHFDANGQMTGITYPGGRKLVYSFDALGRVSGLSSETLVNNAVVNKTLASNITYQPFGPMNSLTYGNNKTLTQTYDLDYRLTDKTITGVNDVNYVYDLTNNITAINNVATPIENQSFTYDKLSRLLDATGIYGDLGYTYDKVGNRLSKTQNTAVDNYQYDTNSHQLLSVTGVNPLVFTHDAMGNTLTKDGLTFTYNQQARMATAAKTGMSASYRYNFKGERSSKLVNGVKTQFIYDLNGQLIAEADATGVIQNEYIYVNGQRLASINNGTLYYVHSDHLDTPIALTDEAGVVQWKAHYTPFGEAIVDVNNIQHNIRFPGQYYDEESGLHYNYFRDYDPEIGRYIQSDPIGLNGGINTYGYVLQNPIKYVDPTGLINLQIPDTTGETAIHANPGPDVTPPGSRAEHNPPHVHMGSNDGPRVRTDTFEPYSDDDARRMSKKQKKFCKKASDTIKDLIRTRQSNVYSYGRRLLGLMALPVFGLDSVTNACRNDPFFCMEMTPFVLDDIEPAECEECNE